ncbi:MAG: hypothetical protein LQ346_008851 [Caloplaca aetnensis]|nr:MAG: hypothetical protein LQ346_008851 [Caloplaca aetnensis]
MRQSQPGHPAATSRKHRLTLNQAGRLAAWITILPFAAAVFGSEMLIDKVRDKVEPPIKRRYGKYRAKKLAEKEAKEKLANTPIPLPPHRPRNLSVVPFKGSTTHCQFLSILPLEIRQEIYKYVVGCKRVHIVRKGKQMAHVRCKCLDSDTDFTRNCRLAARHAYQGKSRLAFTSNGNVALLRTCRQIYTEAVGIMYSTNTFDFDHQDLFLFFARSILPQRLAMIRNLHLCLGTANVDQTFTAGERAINGWSLMWEIIGRDMLALRHLRLRLTEDFPLYTTMYPTLNGDYWVKSILQVRNLKTFHLQFRPASEEDWHEFGDGVTRKSDALENYIRPIVCLQQQS